FAALGFNVDVQPVSGANTLLVSSAIDTGGQGGAGGSSPGPVTSSGSAGARGAFADTLSLRACSAGCLAGTTCDANQVCVPN
ncbi:MAG: hypothetical protein IAE78_25305, partial [Myxococcus sp.]|nr:hypothetical protein [Myxococcus sp.]